MSFNFSALFICILAEWGEQVWLFILCFRFFTLLAESVVIADVSYHVLRLFGKIKYVLCVTIIVNYRTCRFLFIFVLNLDSNLLFEIFVNSTGVVSISARKINKVRFHVGNVDSHRDVLQWLSFNPLINSL